MQSLVLEPSSCSFARDHISSFLEDFQDKNSHLFPSNDLTFETAVEAPPRNALVGQKRKADSLFDPFGSWTEDLLSADLSSIDTSFIDDEALEALREKPVVNLPIKTEPTDRPVLKKRKVFEDDELSTLISDARSLSPPFQVVDFELDSVPEQPLPPVKIQPQAPPVLTRILKTVNQVDDSVCASLFQSFSRLADRAEQGLPTQPCQNVSALDRVQASQDYLTMQTAFGMTMRPPPVIKPEPTPGIFYPMTSGIPFVVNNPYIVPGVSMAMPPVDPSSYSQTMNPASFSNPKKFMAYPPPLIAPQNMYVPNPVHVL